MSYISTHTPREGRDAESFNYSQPILGFQLTRPARGATKSSAICNTPTKFQLTRPARGATLSPTRRQNNVKISTHTPREGRDALRANTSQPENNFNSHAPRGARLLRVQQPKRKKRFQLTRPARGATRPSCAVVIILYISTHTPREGRDFRSYI